MLCALLLFAVFCHTASSPRYFWTNGYPHRSGLKFRTAVLSVLFVMFLLQLYFVLNLFNNFPLRLTNVSVNILLLFQWLQSLPVWSYICCISVHKLLYCSLFSAAFYVIFLSAGIATSVSMHVFSFLFLIISGQFAVSSLCAPLDTITLSHLHVHLLVCVCVWVCACTICVSFRCLVLCPYHVM